MNNNNDGALSFDAIIKDSQFHKSILEMQRRIQGFTDSSTNEITKVDKGFQNLSYSIAGYFSAAALTGFVSQITKVRGEFQQLEIAFETMLGSKEKADLLMAQVIELAGKTPFSLQEAASGAKQLLAFQVPADKVIDTLRRMGDIAAGLGVPIGRLNLVYGQVMAKGKLMGDDLRQFTESGIPMVAELAKHFKTTTDRIYEMVSAGEVGFKDVQDVLFALTDSGGMFAGMMEKSSESLTGLVSQFQDALEVMYQDIGESQEGIIADSIKTGTTVVENYKLVLDILKVLIATYGAYKAAVIVASIAQTVFSASSKGVTVGLRLQYAALVLSERAQNLLNKTMLANPYVLAATLLVGLVVAMRTFNKTASGAEIAQRSLNDAMKRAEENATSQISKIQVLKEQIDNETSSHEQRNKKLKELIALSPELLGNLTLESIKTKEGAKSIDLYIESLKRKLELQEIESELTESLNRQRAAVNNELDASFVQRFYTAAINTFSGTKKLQAAIAKDKEDVNDNVIESENEVQRKLKERIKILDDINTVTDTNGNNTKKVVEKTIDIYDKEIAVLKKRQKEEAKTAAEYKTIQASIDKLEKERSLIDGKPSFSVVQAKKDADKKKKTFDEELAYKRNQYELYLKWIKYVGKNAADNEFKGLLSQGKSYTEYLNNQIKSLEPKILSGKASKEEGNQFSSLNIQYDDITGAKSAMDQFKDSLTSAKSESSDLIDYLKQIKVLQSEMNDDETDLGLAKKRELAEEELSIQNQIRDQNKDKYDEAFEESLSFEQRVLKLKQEYAEKIRILGTTITSQQKQQLDENLQAELDSAFQKTNIYKRLGEEAIVITRAQLKEQIKTIEELLSDGSITGVIKDKLEKDLSSLKINLNIGAKNFNLTNLEAELKTVQEAIDKYLEINEIGAFDALSQSAIDANPELKRLIDRLKEVAGIIVQVKKTANDGGNGLKGFLNKLADSEGLGKFVEYGQMAASAFSDMSSALGGVDTEAGYALDTIGQLVGSAADIGSAIISGDPVKIIGSIVKGVATVFSLSKRTKEMNEAARKSIEDFYNAAIQGEREYQELLDQRAIENVRNNKTRLQGIRDEVALRKEQSQADKKEFDNIKSRVENMQYIEGQEYKHGTWFRKAKVTNVMGSLKDKDFDDWKTLLMQGKLEGEAKALVERLVELEKQGYDSSLAMAEMARETAEIFTGTNVDNLTGTLAQMFREGKTGAKDLAEFFEETMEDAAMSIFKNNVLAESMSDFYEKFTELAESGDELTDSEIESLRAEWLADRESDLAKWEQYKKITGLDLGSSDTNPVQSLQGSVQGIKEETASILAGTFNAIRINQIDHMGLVREQLLHMQEIAVNTRYNKHLESIDKKLDKLDSDPLRAKGLL